ncbi:MAG: ABC transporter permease, partial [Wujia sp.]
MKSNELRGFSSVFKFTLGQALKQKSYIIVLVIMIIVSIGIFPVMKLLGSSGDENVDRIETINRIYVINETGISDFSLEKITDKYAYYSEMEFIPTDEKQEDVCTKLDEYAEAEEINAILVEADMDIEAGGFIFRLYYSAASEVNEDDVFTVSDNIESWFTEYKITSMNVDEELLKDITTPVNTEVYEYDDFIDKDDTKIISMAEYNMTYAVLMVFYMIIVFTSSMVANKIVEEKANRIVEYLMTTVRPMALMLGKIAAMLTAGVGEVVLILISGFASYTVCEKVWPSESESIMTSFISSGAIKGLGVGNIIFCIFIMIVGVCMYSLIAGLFGASVSKIEEIQQGLQVFTIITLVAFFASLISINLMWSVGINAFVKVTMYIPLTSVMIMPGVILIGEASIFEIIISIVIMLLTILFLFWFVSLIYESVIVMNGSIIKFKTMLEMAKDSLNKEKGG